MHTFLSILAGACIYFTFCTIYYTIRMHVVKKRKEKEPKTEKEDKKEKEKKKEAPVLTNSLNEALGYDIVRIITVEKEETKKKQSPDTSKGKAASGGIPNITTTSMTDRNAEVIPETVDGDEVGAFDDGGDEWNGEPVFPECDAEMKTRIAEGTINALKKDGIITESDEDVDPELINECAKEMKKTYNSTLNDEELNEATQNLI